MKYINKGMKTGLLLTIVAMAILSSCNKKVEQFYDPTPVVSTAPALGDMIAAIPTDSLYYKLIVRRNADHHQYQDKHLYHVCTG